MSVVFTDGFENIKLSSRTDVRDLNADFSLRSKRGFLTAFEMTRCGVWGFPVLRHLSWALSKDSENVFRQPAKFIPMTPLTEHSRGGSRNENCYISVGRGPCCHLL